MDNRLQILIDYYEKEQASILQSINDCLTEDVDYLHAHNLSKVLRKTKDKLRIFNYLADNLYDEKTILIARIKMLENWHETSSGSFINPHVAEKLATAKEELEKLNKQHKEPEKSDFTFDDTLEKLIAGQIKYFNLILNKSKNLYLEFRIVKKEFRVTVPNIKRLSERFQFFQSQIKAYKRLGFNLNKNGSKMVLFLPCKSEDDCQQLKIILSRLVFEVLHQFGRGGFLDAYIAYKL